MAQRGVRGYGVPVDRQTGSAGRTVGGNVAIPKVQNPASSWMAGMVPAAGAGQSDGFDYSQDPTQAALEYVNSLKVNPTQRVGGGGSGPNASDMLARDRFNYDRSQDAAAAQKQRDILASYQQMLQGGGYRSGRNQMMELLNLQGTASNQDVENLYGQAMGNIGAGYGDAQQLTGAGYSALQQYLNQNPNNPYANVAVSAGPTQDDLAGLLGAYGVSADPVRAQVAAEGAAAQQGAAGFQNLLDVLGASAQQSDASRLAEMMMAQNYANTSLGSQRAGFESQAARARQDALAEIQAELTRQRMAQEAAALARREAIEDAIAAAGGDVPVVGDPNVVGAPVVGSDTAVNLPGSLDDLVTLPDIVGEPAAPAAPVVAKPKPIDVLKARMETANPDLKKKIRQFVKQNPNAGQKKIEKAFPKIGAKIGGSSNNTNSIQTVEYE